MARPATLSPGSPVQGTVAKLCVCALGVSGLDYSLVSTA